MSQPPPYSKLPEFENLNEQDLYPRAADFYPAVTIQPLLATAPPPPQPAPVQTTVIINSASGCNAISNASTNVVCPSCHANVMTRVKHSATCCTHIKALCLCIWLCWPCVCLPYCMDSCQNAKHYCPNCNAYIGTYQN